MNLFTSKYKSLHKNLFSTALLADSIKHRPCKVPLESMVCQHMLTQMCHLLAFQVDHFPAFLAFAVEAYMLMTVLLMSQIFEACAACTIYHIFGNQPLLHHPV